MSKKGPVGPKQEGAGEPKNSRQESLTRVSLVDNWYKYILIVRACRRSGALESPSSAKRLNDRDSAIRYELRK